MHRGWHSRLLAALLAAWFAVMTAEPAALHVCAAHSGHVEAQAGADAADAHAGHAARAHAGHADADAGSPASDDAHACTCLGHCCGVAPVVVGAARPTLQAALVAPPSRPGRPAHEYVAARVAFVLPFATAPPVTFAA